MNGNPQQDQQEHQHPNQHPSQPLEIQPDGTWILGKGADRWMPTKYQIGDMRWLVERDLRKELGVPPKYARDAEKIEFHKRQLALLDLAKQAPRCEHVFTDGRCCKAPRVKKGKLCYAHTLMEEKRPLELNLPPLEDANAVMLWLMDVLRGLAEGRTTEKTAGIMLYGLQLAMVNARFTTFRDTNHVEMVRKAPKTRAKPQRTRRNTKEEAAGDFTAKDAEVAKKEDQRELATPRSEETARPQRTQRGTEEKPARNFTAEAAEVAKKEDQRELATPRSEETALPQRTQRNTEEDFTAEAAENAETEERRGLATPRSEEKALPQRTQRSTEEEAAVDFTAKDAKVAKKEDQRELATPRSEETALPQRTQRSTEEEAAVDFTARDAKVAKEEKPEEGTALRIEDSLEPQNAEEIPGVESAKSIYFGVEAGEGVADNRPVSPPSEPPRKSSQSEVLVIPKDVEHYAGR